MKRISIIKRLFVIALIFLLSINTFGAIVADSDGGAFLTKGEFDEIKNSFAQQIDDYGNSISKKIDGAIGSYLDGIKISTQQKVDCNIQSLDWPVTIIDKLSLIENVTTSATNNYDQESLWKIGFTIFGIGYRSCNLILDKFFWNPQDKILYYLNGPAVTSGNTFKVTDIGYNPSKRVTNNFHHENLINYQTDTTVVAGDTIYTTLFLDHTNAIKRDGASVAVTANTNYTRPNIQPNYGVNALVKNYKPIFYAQHNAMGVPSISGTVPAAKQDYYDLMKTTHTAYWYEAAGWGINWDKQYTSVYECIPKPLDRIYNYGDSTNKSHFAPTTQDYDLWITNKKANRKYYTADKKLVWNERGVSAVNHGVKFCIDLGENLEHENEDTTRDWFKKALISADRLIYDFKTDSTTVTDHKMVNGIPIFSFPKDVKADEIQKVVIDLKFTSQPGYETNPKYLIVSKSPITTQVYSDNVDGVADYLTIVTVDGVKNTTKKVQLKNGVSNLIGIGDMKPNEIIYIKILWNDTNEEQIVLDKPNITFYN